MFGKWFDRRIGPTPSDAAAASVAKASGTGGAYTVDGDDSIHVLTDVPQCSPGSPMPLVLASEHQLILAYLTNSPELDGNDGDMELTNLAGKGETVCVLQFERAGPHYFGSPNDEALHGHPLYVRGLVHYKAFEVRSSSWIRALERMNAVHHRHQSKSFDDRRHFILTFHDSTFECVATGYTFEIRHGDMRQIVGELTTSI